ncbi:TD and POZ domain-containing protein 3 [Trichonephila inaurata madagascariensis]|uniref:TD and POZ domain-containing protein 3 n=1 Tax=Trichonephila inaurata madagascariensis TaxID=2747483 RepID=A0A8X6IS14_9ARAC|nr:TD and POZ domain-containing protein 3 [Trichonephila inaurata madagascariensis]
MASNGEAENDACITIFWNIENYSYRSESIRFMECPVIKGISRKGISWNLELYQDGDTDERHISYHLRGSLVRESKDVHFEFDCAILLKDGSFLRINKNERICLDKEKTGGYEFFVLRKNITKTCLKNITKTCLNVFLFEDMRFRCRLWKTDEKLVKPVTFFARTVVGVEELNFFWDIARFSSLGSGNRVAYVVRSESGKDMVALNIGVKKEQITIYAEALNQNFFFKFQSFVIDTNRSEIECGKKELWLNINVEKVICTLPFTKKCVTDNKIVYLKNGVLSLYCECSWTNGCDIHRIEKIDFGPCTSNRVVQQMDKLVDLKVDLQCLYDEGVFSDVKLRTATQVFHAHKTILSARSPVFRAMFNTDMKEKIQECVDIQDLEDDTVRRMLMYVYTNEMEDLQWESALKLHFAADKYHIVGLRNKCCSFLKRNMCPSTVCDVLVLADMHGDGELKTAAQDYALAHGKEIFQSDEWRLLAEHNSTLAIETILLKFKKR